MYKDENPPFLAFDDVGYWLANCLVEKWYAETEVILEIINKGLSSNLGGGAEFKETSWFILVVANLGYNITVDYSKYNYPKDMKCYQEAIDNWNTNDLDKVNDIVSKLCDFHLENATYGKTETTMDIQFGDSKWFVHTFEILAWLSIRERAGLDNPTVFNHPLMQLKLNQLPTAITKMPKDDLFDKIMGELNIEKADKQTNTEITKKTVTYEDYTAYSGETDLTLEEIIDLFESMDWVDGSFLYFTLNEENTFQVMSEDSTKFLIEMTNGTEEMIFKQRYATNEQCKEIIPYFFQDNYQKALKDFYNVPINKTLDEVIREKLNIEKADKHTNNDCIKKHQKKYWRMSKIFNFFSR